MDYTNPDWLCIHGVVNHQCKKCWPNRTEFITGVEFGVRCAEKGMNLQAAIAAAMEIMEPQAGS